MQYLLVKHTDLNIEQLYNLLKLRQEVFIVEQDCPYLDTDGKDLYAHHLMGYDKQGQLVSYARLLPKKISYEQYVSIGRVITALSVRGTGAGKELMLEAVQSIQKLYPNQAIKISAQAHLSTFYQSIGFAPNGEEYMEDNIPHIGMILNY